MKRLILVLTAFLSIILPALASDIEGSWEGKLEITPQVGLRIVLHISRPEGLQETVTLDSPDQGAYGIPTEISCLTEDSVSVSVKQLMLQYDGVLQNDTIYGTFRQGGMTLPLNFIRVQEEAAAKPQTPQPPFPYESKEIRFKGGDEEVMLAGTLTVPFDYDSRRPVVIMVSGSGTQNRDEEIFGHKPFAVIADRLAREGIPSLRYDDRGAFESTGDPTSVTTATNAQDAMAAIKFLKEQHFNGKIGVLGHSEGGSVAFMTANMEEGPDFIITLSAPTVRGDSILLFQNRHALEKGGMPEKIVDDYVAALSRILAIKNLKPGEILTDDIFLQICPDWDERIIYKDLKKNLKNVFSDPNPWLNFFISYDPSDDLRKIKIPSLIIYGDRDTQVPSFMNYSPAYGFIPSADVRLMPGLNHLLQHAETGEISEYANIEETIAPEVLDLIVGFILAQ